MNIIVCIKQVPDISSRQGGIEVKLDPETHTLIRKGVPSVVNPLDMYAIEEALRIRNRGESATHPYKVKVTVISMGPPQAKEALKEAISMGADSAILISDPNFAGADTLATSFTLATAIKKMGDMGNKYTYRGSSPVRDKSLNGIKDESRWLSGLPLKFDLILCGKQAIDGDTAQVPSEVAEFLDIPVVTFVRKIEEIIWEASPDADTRPYKVIVERLVEGGFEVVETSLPALFTVVKEINEPRLPSLKGKLLAKRTEIPVWGIEALDVEPDEVGLSGSPTQVIRTFTPEQKRAGEILKCSTDEAVEKLFQFLKEEKLGE